jgi:hypothetical protein
MKQRPDYPKPFVITVGMSKGGACKTWTAFNLASFLGLAEIPFSLSISTHNMILRQITGS